MAAYLTDEQSVDVYRRLCHKLVRARTARGYRKVEDRLEVWRSLLRRAGLLTAELDELYVRAMAAGETKDYVKVVR